MKSRCPGVGRSGPWRQFRGHRGRRVLRAGPTCGTDWALLQFDSGGFEVFERLFAGFGGDPGG